MLESMRRNSAQGPKLAPGNSGLRLNPNVTKHSRSADVADERRARVRGRSSRTGGLIGVFPETSFRMTSAHSPPSHRTRLPFTIIGVICGVVLSHQGKI